MTATFTVFIAAATTFSVQASWRFEIQANVSLQLVYSKAAVSKKLC